MKGNGLKGHSRRKVLKRGWDSITIDILAAALHPERKMRIMYKANLNYERFSRYFYDLVEKGFIVKVEDSCGKAVYYQISERGKTLLATLRKAHELMNSES